MNTARAFNGGTGTKTAALAASGSTGSGGNPPITVNAETWNGTSWTEVGNLNSGRSNQELGGSSTSAVCFAGYPASALNESWNGTSWTEVADLNEARYAPCGTGSSNTAALFFGGSPWSAAHTEKTEKWNGTAWAEQNDLSSGRIYSSMSKAGYTNALMAGGNTGGPSGTEVTATEEWTDPVLSTKTADTD